MKIEYWQSTRNSKWYFHLKAKNHKIVAQSEGYEDRQDCLKTISMLVGIKSWTVQPKKSDVEE
jgi:uncharacterized protein YegP (UPF0339 family)